MKYNPLISIITVCFNEEKNIVSTLQSVEEQIYQNIEYIIIDGGSTDKTLSFLENFKSSITILISEKDNGLYDAMNKGIKVANGEWIIFLNSGDTFFNNEVLLNVVESIEKENRYDIIYGNTIMANPGKYKIQETSYNHQLLNEYPSLRHGACLIRSEYHKKNLYQTNRKDLGFALDYLFLFNAFNTKRRFKKIEMIFIQFLAEGVSNNLTQSIRYNYRINGSKSIQSFLKAELKIIFHAINGSRLGYPFKMIRLFMINWVGNQVISIFPLWSLRKLYYRLTGLKINKGSIINQGFSFFELNKIYIGNNVHLNRNCFIDGRGKCFIGSNVSISHNVMILTSSHDTQSTNFEEIRKPVTIKDNVWIGARATILPGVKIGEGAVIAAGAIVAKDVPDFQIYGGVPAVKIGERVKNLDYKCNWTVPFI